MIFSGVSTTFCTFLVDCKAELLCLSFILMFLEIELEYVDNQYRNAALTCHFQPPAFSVVGVNFRKV